MATTPKRIQRIQGPISALNAGQIGVEDTVDADLGFKMHGGKDGAGGVTKWLAKDKPARVSEMTVQDLGAGAVVSDATGRLITAVIPGFQDLQSVMETGSTATIATDIEIEIEQNAPLSGTANPIYGRERIRNIGAESASAKASQWRRRAEGNSGNSYAESNQTASESTGGDDYISDIAAVDTQSARIRCRVIGGVSTASMTAQNVVLTDENCSGGIPLAESGVTALSTSSQSLVGAINELAARSYAVDIDYTASSSATLTVLSHGVSDGQCGSIEADVMAAPKPGTEGSALYHIAASWWYDWTLVMGVAQVVRTPWAPATNAATLDAAEVVTVTASGSNILLNFALETGARVVGNYKVIAVTLPTPPS